MQPWSRKKGILKAPFYFTQLDPQERENLGNGAANLANILMTRAQSAPKDELAEMTGMPNGHADAPMDPGLRRVLPDFYREGDEEFEGENALARQLNETDLIKGKLQNLALVTDALGPSGSVNVSLEEGEVFAWLAALTDIRNYYYGQMLSFIDNPDVSSEQIQTVERFVEWLAFHQESLLYAVTGETYGEE